MSAETPELHDLLCRVERLERQNSWQKRAGLAALAAVGAVLLMVSGVSARRGIASARQEAGKKSVSKGPWPSSVTVVSVPRGWKTYTDKLHRFRISYPPNYKLTHIGKPKMVQPRDGEKYIVRYGPVGAVLLTRPTHSDAAIVIYVSGKPFDLQRFVRQAPTGVEQPPLRIRVGDKTFYYYGPGGGGVCYPDQYFYNLRGKTLYMDFEGPCVNDKTPDAATKALEPVMLASLRVMPK
jgi:hypothetical protein